MGTCGYWGLWARILSVLVLAGALVQACSDNKGPAGPTFPTKQVGAADTSFEVVVTTVADPPSVHVGQQAAITVIVANLNGFGIPGRQVQLTSNGGQFTGPKVGVTDGNGRFATTFLCRAADAGLAPEIQVFVQGVIGVAATGFVTCTA